ncbi:Major facilitator transporter-like protein [Mycena venus]|uniref:Major facilitator transporter-like protein n=1 Tax=Mycena venus TaxID=2733690 RepID=A0A8H6YSY7_9AGAR|nr:Major facilitator transporter-like protein [Mycena venus]
MTSKPEWRVHDNTFEAAGSHNDPPERVEIMDGAENTILTGRKLYIIFSAMLLSILLIALDETILATALPRIASDFESFTLQGWVATSFVLAHTVFLLFYGQVLAIFPAKWVMVTAIIIFELGSLLCGVSQNVDQLIAGRTVSGAGAAGIFVSSIQIISQVTRLEDRPVLFAMAGAVFGVSSIVGPLVGGALTDHVTWRWCFFINLPVGGVSVTAVTLLLKAAPPLGSDPSRRSVINLLRQAARMDFVGATLVSGAVTSIILALQWGGNTKPWNDKAVIICFVLSAVLAIAFLAWEIYLGEKAMTPTAVMHSKSIYAILAYCFLDRFAILVYSYYIPIFFQAVRHHSATKSGIDILPFMLAQVLTIIAAGQVVSRMGYYWHFLALGPIFLGVGSGLLYTVNTSSTGAKIAGFQIILGVGTGMGVQNTLLAIQTEFKDKPSLLGQATGMATFAQFLGGTLGLGIAEPILASELGKYLARFAPDAPAAIVRQTPTAIYTLPTEMIGGVVRAYTESLRLVFVLGVPIAGLALIAAVLVNNLKIEKTGTDSAPEGGDLEKGALAE